MKILLIAIFLFAPVNDINKIARINALKKEAKEAFNSENYNKAIQSYHYLLDSMEVDEDAIRLNLANSYYKINDTTSAVNFYNQLTASENKKISSVAYQQLGIVKNKQKKHKEALEDFKQALRNDPTNEEARYNYELLKKLLNDQKEEQQKDQNKDEQKDQKEKDKEEQKQKDQQQEQKDQQDQQKQEDQQKQDQDGKEDEQEQKDQQKKDEEKPGDKEDQQKKNEGKPDEPSDEQKEDQEQMPMSPDKLKDMKISEEKAKMILEALKNQEVQYLQQKTRKAKQRQSSDKPDW